MRYSPDLSTAGLQALGLGDIEPAQVHKLDSITRIEDIRRVGEACARRHVLIDHFEGFDAPAAFHRASPVTP